MPGCGREESPYVMLYQGKSLIQAIEYVRQKRPQINPNPGFIKQLILLDIDLGNSDDFESARSEIKLARMLGTKQASISKLEHRTDIYISTLRGYIEAMGGHLKIIAQFNDSEVVINQFQELGKKHTAVFS